MIWQHAADIAEVAGTVNGLLGAWLCALRMRFSHWGWVAYLASNFCWLIFAVTLGRWWMLAQTVGFIMASLVGIWNHCLVSHDLGPGRLNKLLSSKKYGASIGTITSTEVARSKYQP